MEIPGNTGLAAVRQLATECSYSLIAEATVPEYKLDLRKGHTLSEFADKGSVPCTGR